MANFLSSCKTFLFFIFVIKTNYSNAISGGGKSSTEQIYELMAENFQTLEAVRKSLGSNIVEYIELPVDPPSAELMVFLARVFGTLLQEAEKNNNTLENAKRIVDGEATKVECPTIQSPPTPPPTPKPAPRRRKSTDCCDILLSPDATPSGVYAIFPFSSNKQKSVTVWCDMTIAGGGWTVYERWDLPNPRLNYSRNWNDYKNGFGDPKSDYWLGLEALHQLTKRPGPHELRRDMWNTDNIHNFSHYNDFSIGNEASKYLLRIGKGLKGINYFVVYRNNTPFSTFDRDYDGKDGRNCAKELGEGHWTYFDKNKCIGFLRDKWESYSYTTRELKTRPAACFSGN